MKNSRGKQGSSDEGKDLESSTASSASSTQPTANSTATFTWNETMISAATAATTLDEPVEGVQPASSRLSKKLKRKAMEAVEEAAPEETPDETTAATSTEKMPASTDKDTTAKFGAAMDGGVRNHRAPSRIVNPMVSVRAKTGIITPVADEDEEEDSLEDSSESNLDDTIDVMQKYLQSLAPELRKRLNAADYSILLSSVVRLCQEMLGWNDKTIVDDGNLKTKSLSQLNKSIDINVATLANQMTRMAQEKGVDTKKSIVRTLREMKKLLEAPLLQERIELNPGEDVEWKCEGVMNLEVDEDDEEVGRLVFTNYRFMYFGPNAETTPEHGAIPDMSIPLATIATISKLGDKKISSKMKRLEIVTKDQRVIRWGFKAGSHRRKEIFAWFKNYIAAMPNNLFCFQVFDALAVQKATGGANGSRGKSSKSGKSKKASSGDAASSSSPSAEPSKGTNGATLEIPDERTGTASPSKKRALNTADPTRPEFDGWTFYDPHTEFHRQGVTADAKWTYTNANVDYGLCDTYPTALWVPSAFPSESLAGAASFRSRNRLPALAYYHRQNGATITRCSQPAVGVSRKRSKEDELLLGEIARANAHSNRLPIFDARPKANAVANTAMGYGYELIQYYPNCSLTFCDIENIHVMRGSLTKLRDAIHHGSTESSHYLADIDASGWLSHQVYLINSALRIVDLIHEQDTSVLIHCSDGWDRTAQLVSLSCLMLDPYFRTLNGFATLIEKDWLSFGHRFALRHALDGTSSGDRAPIFHQFVESVWQFVRQQPLLFEFNEAFLITLLDEVYNAYYGTFLYDCVKERADTNLPSKSLSFWTAVLSAPNRDKFINPLYSPQDDVVLMNGSPQCLGIWDQYYLRHQPKYILPPSIDRLLALAYSSLRPQNASVPSSSPSVEDAVGAKTGGSVSSSPPGQLKSVGSGELSKKKAPYKRSKNAESEK